MSVAQNVAWCIFVNLPGEHENNLHSAVAIIRTCDSYPVDEWYIFNIRFFARVGS